MNLNGSDNGFSSGSDELWPNSNTPESPNSQSSVISSVSQFSSTKNVKLVDYSSTSSENITDEHDRVADNIKSKSKSLRDKNKKLRMYGKDYVGFKSNESGKQLQNIIRNSRSIGAPCNSNYCRKSMIRKCDELTSDRRKLLFKSFWNMSWEQKKLYIRNHVKRVTKNISTVGTNSRRLTTLKYHLNVNSAYVPVCKLSFLNTLGIKEGIVRSWVQIEDVEMHSSAEFIKLEKPAVLRDRTDTKSVVMFLDQLNKLPSHYCRKQTSKLYLEQNFTSYKEVYDAYKEFCSVESLSLKSRTTMMNQFRQKNLALYIPKKDRCDICVQFEAGNYEQGKYNMHVKNKDRAQHEKSLDKIEAEAGKCIVLCMDLQGVKTCPLLNASSFYFKTKLSCHNFTIYNEATKQATCYWFDETICDLQSSVFASFLLDYLNRKVLYT